MSCGRFPSLFLPTLLGLLLLVAACGGENPDGESGDTGSSTASSTAGGDSGTNAGAGTREPRSNVPTADVAQSWTWQHNFDPEYLPPLDWNFEERLEAAAWGEEVLLEINGEKITADELEEWLYLTRGEFATENYLDRELARNLRRRMGMNPVTPVDDALAETLYRQAFEANQVASEHQEAAAVVLFNGEKIAQAGLRMRVDIYRNLFGEGWSPDKLPPLYQPLFTGVETAQIEEALEKLNRGEETAQMIRYLRAPANSVIALERIIHLYTRYDHDDGLGGIATIVTEHEPDGKMQGYQAPWTFQGVKQKITIDDLRRDVGVAWSPEEKRAGLRVLAAYRTLRKAHVDNDRWEPNDARRWDDYWTSMAGEVMENLPRDLHFKLSAGVPSMFEVRAINHLLTYDRIQHKDRLSDIEHMTAYLDGERWSVDRWLYTGAVIVVPFVDPATDVSAGAEAEEEARRQIQKYRGRLEAGENFEALAKESVERLPELPTYAKPPVIDWFQSLKSSDGRLLGNRDQLRMALYESAYDRILRGTSVIDAFVQLQPGESTKPIKGSKAWFVLRMHKAQPSRPPSTIDDAQYLGPGYLEYRVRMWISEVLRGAKVQSPS